MLHTTIHTNAHTAHTENTISNLTPGQRSTLIGSLLGDGHLKTFTRGRTYRLMLSQGGARGPGGGAPSIFDAPLPRLFQPVFTLTQSGAKK